METLISNALMARQEFFRQFMDPRRNIDDECGYPDVVNEFAAEEYQKLYESEPVAWRVVNLMPQECWQVTPEVIEVDDGEETEFEKAVQELNQTLRSDQSYYAANQGNALWEYLYRTDVLSGIGSWGILLLGFNDGRMLQDPLEGMPPDGRRQDITGVSGLSEVSKDIYGPTGVDARPTDRESGTDAYGGAIPVVDPLSSMMGTDALYRGVQFTPQAVGEGAEGEQGRQTGSAYSKRKGPLKLLFVRPYAQYLVQIVQYEADITNPRFGHPVMYLVTLNDPRQQHTGIGLPLATVRVHWTRVLHVAEALQSSEIFGIPRMRPVLKRLLDLQKLYGGSAEMYWKGAFFGLSLETHPQLGGDVVVNNQQTLDMMEQYMNGLQRYLALTGMSAKTLSPTVVDPTGQIQVQIEAICIAIGCPVRVFKGSERGELASSQDDEAWNERKAHRQNMHITPRIIVPFLDRLIQCGVLPKPKEYFVRWPDLEAISKKDKAAIALTTTQAVGAYVSQGVEQLIPPQEYLTRILELDDEEAEEMLDQAKKAHEQGDTMTVPSQEEEDQQRQDAKDKFKAMAQGQQPGGGKPQFGGKPQPGGKQQFGGGQPKQPQGVEEQE